MDRPIAYQGQQRTVVFALTAGNGCPGLEFYNALDLRDKAKVLKLFQMMGDRAWIYNTEKFKVIEGTKFHEFKSKRIRMPCFQSGSLWIVTHGFEKKDNKIDPEQIRRAERIKREDFERSSKKRT